MSEDWPPRGYSDPKPYEQNNRLILGIAIGIALPVIVLIKPVLESGSTEFLKLGAEIGRGFGLIDSSILFLISLLLSVVIWILVSGSVIIAIHEGIHYVTAILLGLKPVFEWTHDLGFMNPTVVVYSNEVSRRQNILMLSAPFVLLSILCATAMWFTTGVLAATAAIMLALNAVPSCADLYNVGRLALMPKGTIFTNFNKNGNLRTEYTTPIDSTDRTEN